MNKEAQEKGKKSEKMREGKRRRRGQEEEAANESSREGEEEEEGKKKLGERGTKKGPHDRRREKINLTWPNKKNRRLISTSPAAAAVTSRITKRGAYPLYSPS